MIESLSIRNFKVLREVDVELKPLTLIVGPNASGKSSILQAIRLLLNETVRNLSPFSSRAPKGDAAIKALIDGVFYHSVQRYEDLGWIAVLLDLDPRKLSQKSHPKDVSFTLPPDGEGLASVLAGLKLEKPLRFENIVERLIQVVPNVKGIRIRRVRMGEQQVGDEILFDMVGAEGIPAWAASQGTLLTLGILTALSVHDGPTVVLIDDLERGLHPKAMARFIEQLRGIQGPKLQIVATCHSPYLIDCVKAEEVLLTSLDESGYAVVRPLTDHPEYEHWKGFMTTGEFWSNVGEDWIVKGTKAPAS